MKKRKDGGDGSEPMNPPAPVETTPVADARMPHDGDDERMQEFYL